MLPVVVFASRPDAAAEYARTLDKLRIPYVDCNVTATLRMAVPGEGHPNGLWHDLVTDCVDTALRSRVRMK
jgi:hypothetical protein